MKSSNSPRSSFQKLKVDEIKAPHKGSIVSGPFGSNIGKKYFVDEGIPLIRGNNLTFGEKKFIDEGFVYITEEKAYELRNCEAIPGDLIFTAAGTLGQVGLIPGNPKYSKYIISNKQLRLRCNPKLALPTYLFYWFTSGPMREQIINLNTGSSVPLITLGALRILPVFLPSLIAQYKIASILSAYDDLIENNTRRIAILEEVMHSLYQEWFVNFRYPGHEKNKMVESELGVIPEDWKTEKLGNLAYEVRRGVNPDAVDPETPYFGLEHLPKRSIALQEWGTAKEVHSTKFIFKRGEILFGKIRPYFHKVGVAPLDGICSSDTIIIIPKAYKYYEAVLCCVSSEDFVNYATQTSQGTKMPRANWEILMKYPLVLPPDTILAVFNETVHNIALNIQNLIFRNRNLCRTRDMLLPKLISGEIDVEALDIDIPDIPGIKAQKDIPIVASSGPISATQLALPLV